jgi:hypothetical protein
VRAYALDAKVGNAIIAWKPGMPPPADLASLRDVTSNLIGVIRAFGPSDKATQMLAYAQQSLDELTRIIDAFGGKVALDQAVSLVTKADLAWDSDGVFLYPDFEQFAQPAADAGAHVYVARLGQWVPFAVAQEAR